MLVEQLQDLDNLKLSTVQVANMMIEINCKKILRA